MSEKLRNLQVEYHILQSFPVTCLNRDDVGAPKTAVVGGVTRARVSSQCWKRQVRMALAESGVKIGTRTKKIAELVAEQCRKKGATVEAAETCAGKMADFLRDDTLLFISEREAEAFAAYAEQKGFDPEQLKEKELVKVVKKATEKGLDALDIALFGRMVAKAAELNVEAACSFAHAISTHRVSNEIEFFTALDDLLGEDETGSAHMGTLEYNSATYYRYISLDLGQLVASLDPADLPAAVEQLTRALFVAVPAARQTTQSGASPWEFARVMLRHGQRLQVPFETPVPPEKGGFLVPSIRELKAYLEKKEKLCGSLFGKVWSRDWGEDENYSIDHLIGDLKNQVEEALQ
jgi:CRISPR system Cascade subunit CasC